MEFKIADRDRRNTYWGTNSTIHWFPVFTQAPPWPQWPGYPERSSQQETVECNKVRRVSNFFLPPGHFPAYTGQLVCPCHISALLRVEDKSIPFMGPPSISRVTFKSRECVLETFPEACRKAPCNQINKYFFSKPHE